MTGSGQEHSAEQVVVAGMLSGGVAVIDEVTATLSERSFTDPVCRQLFVAIRTYRGITSGVLTEQGLLDQSRDAADDAGAQALATETFRALAASPVGVSDTRWAVSRVRADRERADTSRALSDASEIAAGSVTDAEGNTWTGPTQAREWAGKRFAEIEAESVGAAEVGADVRTEAEVILNAYAAKHRAAESGEPDRLPRFGIPSLDGVLEGIAPGELFVIGGAPGQGKAQPLDASVLTPTGFRRMGDLKVGDPVIDPEGQSSEVTGVFPQGVRDVYRVEFADGSSCEADADHLWKTTRHVRTKKGRYLKEEVLLTSDLLPSRKIAVPYLGTAPELSGGDDELPLSPYVLGVLLGDGSWTCGATPQLTSADADLVECVWRELPFNVEVRLVSCGSSGGSTGRYTLRGVCVHPDHNHSGGVSERGLCGWHWRYECFRGRLESWLHRPWNAVTSALDEMGLRDGSSSKRYVPDNYKHASVAVRLAVLQGLMDTDGSVDAHGTGTFDVSSRQLRDDVVWLARSLGFRVSENGDGVEHQYYNFSHKKWREAHPRYRCRISARGSELPNPFRLRRKACLFGSEHVSACGRNAKLVRSVTFSRRAEVQCIRVSAPSQLYVTNDFTVTHNSQMTVQLLHHAVFEQGLHVYFATSETLRTTVRARLIARHSRQSWFESVRRDVGAPQGLNSRMIDKGRLPREQLPLLQAVVHDLCADPERRGYGIAHVAQVPNGATVRSVMAQVGAADRRAPVDLLIVDYLALLSADRRYSEARNELVRIIIEAKRAATTFRDGEGVAVVSPWQLSRSAQEEMARSGADALELRGLADTAEIERSADGVMFMVPEGALEQYRYQGMRLPVPKNRDGESRTGEDAPAVRMDYATSCVTERVGAAEGSANGSANGHAEDSWLESLSLDGDLA